VDAQLTAWAPSAPSAFFEEAQAEYHERRTSDTSSRGYAEACPVAGVEHDAYRLREIELGDGASLIAGIHFLGSQVKQPFVGVFAQSCWLEGEALRAAHLQLLKEFEAFNPQASWWWTPSGKQLCEQQPAKVDQHLVAGSLHEIRRVPALGLPASWELRQLSSAAEIDEPYRQLYADFHGARPDLEGHVEMAGQEDMQECADMGGLFCFFEGSQLIGLVAAQPEQKFGVRAWTMWEIVLARPYCGRGLAPAMQRVVLDNLDMDQAALVIGTVHGKNLPSLKTALRVGRRIVGCWTFLRS